MELQAVTGQLYIINGDVQGTTTVPGLLAQSAPTKTSRGRERDFLFVHLTLSGKPEDTAVLTQDLLDALSRRFYQTTGSVTAALRSSINEANELLLRLNLSGSSPNREGAITCAVLHNDELFMLQAGESLALLGHNFGVERLPKTTPDRITPLGRTAGIDIRYFHHRLHSGDMLLLADPRIAHLPTQSLSQALVDTEIELGLAELRNVVGDDSARLLLIEFTDEAPAGLPDMVQPSKIREDPLATVPQPAPLRDPQNLPAAYRAVTPESRRLQPDRPARPTPIRGPDIPRIPYVEPPIDVEKTARKATSGAALGLSRFTNWLAELLTRLRPRQEAGAGGPNWALPTLLAVSIPVIVAIVVTGVYLQRGRIKRFADIKVEIGKNLALVDESGEAEDIARSSYNQILLLAAEAETLRPGDAEIDRLRQEALFELDRLNNVTRLNARVYYQYDEKVNLQAVALREGFNGGIFTLDKGSSTVYQHGTDESYMNPTTPSPERIVFGGQTIGSHIVNDIVDLMWRPVGNAVTREGLAMLDRNGALITFYPNFNDLRAVPLGLASDWRLPMSITTFDERLYVLDTGANQIWKYFPDGDGFILKDDERSITFNENPGLDKSVDFAIYSEDGSLIVLYSDGRFRYYDTRSGRIQWDETRLLQNGLSFPFISPTAVELVGKGLNSSIFVADGGSGRIVQISRGGTVLAQYKAIDAEGRELFSQISDLAVAETPLRIFVTAGNTLYLVTQE